jgi:hypothetical protein
MDKFRLNIHKNGTLALEGRGGIFSRTQEWTRLTSLNYEE